MTDFVMPGDKLGLIEEVEGGPNTFDDGETIRASSAGMVDLDKKSRLVHVRNGRQLSIPKKGDIVIGTVAMMLPSMIAVAIHYLNGKPNSSGVECICQNPDRKRIIARMNDVVALKVETHQIGRAHV